MKIIFFPSFILFLSYKLQKVLQQKDLPIPKLTIQTINASSVRANWYLDRPIPSDAHIATYEVHVRGKNFPGQMTSDEK